MLVAQEQKGIKITAPEYQESLRSPLTARSTITIAAAAANASVWLWTIRNSSFSQPNSEKPPKIIFNGS